jgi:uncharacterized OB-fold protein
VSYLPSGMPSPEPSPEDAPFWQACRERKLLIRHCNACQQFFHPPMPSCPHCGSTDVDWKEVSGEGTVFSYTVAHHAVHKALKGHGPYNIVVVMLNDADDVRLVSNLVDSTPADIRIGMPVTVYWDEVENGMFLPRFRKATTAQPNIQEAS